MYNPPHFRSDDRALLRDIVDQQSFGVLLCGPAPDLAISHIPFLLEGDTLSFHLARANPQVHALDGATPAIAIVQGPHAYVSPRWYRTAGQVPTWNFAAVHLHGTPQPIHDQTEAHALLARMTARYEGNAPDAWTMPPLDDPHTRKLLRGIVGFRMDITRWDGKLKMSQNRHPDDRAGARDGLHASGTPEALAVVRLMDYLGR